MGAGLAIASAQPVAALLIALYLVVDADGGLRSEEAFLRGRSATTTIAIGRRAASGAESARAPAAVQLSRRRWRITSIARLWDWLLAVLLLALKANV